MSGAVRLGILRLTDSAPAVLADEAGLFAQAGVEVALLVEPSWANVADKLDWGGLEAAIMPLPLALAAALGLRGTPARLRIAMGISRGGNSIVVGGEAARSLPGGAGAAESGRQVAAWLAGQATPPRFAVVHRFSSHHLLLRSWLAQAGVDARDALDIVVVPPERVVEELAAGRVAGFCAGAPWGDRAEELGAGRVLLGTSAIRAGHAEKCLVVTEALAARRPDAVRAMMGALRAAQALCAADIEAPALAGLLARLLDLPLEATRAALPGGAGREAVAFADAAAIDAAELRWFHAALLSLDWRQHGREQMPERLVEPI